MPKLYWIAIAILFYLSACTKIESTNIGTGLIPPIDGVTTLDTIIDIVTNNFEDTASQSLKVYSSDDHIIGRISNDPIFGTTTAVTYLELKPTSYKFTLPGESSLVPQSAVLVLSYKSVFGDSTIPQEWEVKELDTTLRNDIAYSANTMLEVKSDILNPLSQTLDISHFDDSLHDDFEDAANQIRIPLSSEFAERMIKEYTSEDGHPYASDSLFRSKFKGFAIGPKSGSAGNALVRINLLDTNTKLALYYKYKAAATDTFRAGVSYLRFSSGSGSAVSGSANYIKRDYSSATIKTEWGSSSGSSQSAFIQTSPGSFTTVQIPQLPSFANAIIHRAELLCFQDTEDDNLYSILTPPRYLLLSNYDTADKVKTNIHNDFIVSSGVSNIATFGGFLSEKHIDSYGDVKAYTFDLTRYVQGVVTRKDSSKTLRLSAPVNDSLRYTDPYPITASSGMFYFQPSIANNPADGRVVLGGGSSAKPQIRMRLRIIYSRI